MSKILTVFGATGNQGGSLINYVVNSSKLSKIYKLRGVTRDVSKPAALALKEKGVEVVKVTDRGNGRNLAVDVNIDSLNCRATWTIEALLTKRLLAPTPSSL